MDADSERALPTEFRLSSPGRWDGRVERPSAKTFVLSSQDAVEWLRGLEDESVDLVVTDPAYESLEKHRAVGTTTRLKHSKASSNDWFSIFPNARFPELFAELYRVLADDSHFYLFCDAETMFVAKPLAERAGFKFWKPLVWDKCLGGDTPVWTTRGVIPLAQVCEGDRVATPRGTLSSVIGRRIVRAQSVRLALSDGTTLIASREHRFIRHDGREVEAAALQGGDELLSAGLLAPAVRELDVASLVDEDDAVLEPPEPTACLWCGKKFASVRAAAAHQARFCAEARSKASMADEIGVKPKTLRRWLSSGRIPSRWATHLGRQDSCTGKVRLLLQNDAGLWYPETISLDYRWGKLVGLFAAEGSFDQVGVSFAFHSHEKHLHSHVARLVRSLGVKALLRESSENGVVVQVSHKMVGLIIRHFVGGRNALTKHFLPSVYEAPSQFQQGVFDGLIEGDGHWSHHEQRESVGLASLDLASFVHRHALSQGLRSTMRRFENAASGGWKVRFDPAAEAIPLTVVSIEDAGLQELHDIAIDDVDELYVLGNGLVTHNCHLGMGYHYRARHEFILFFEKGKRKLNDLSIADVISCPRIRGGYPAEKPSAVSEVLIRQSSEPGQLVIDPFMGSGSVGAAAIGLGRSFRGTDVCAEAVAITERRLLEAGGVPG